MVKKVVLDTNILVDFLRQPKKATLFEKLVKEKKLKILLPAVVLTELYVGRSAAKPSQQRRLEEIFKKTELVLADKNISKRAGILMCDFPHLYLADALVAATALEKKAFLCTLNKSHFKKIPSLTLY